ncbi:hypothetical protein CDL15_Pgr011518 [Punica granatum]|nr:hypothetical protein CDL15_Pgr011518 [Punica granatum]
MDSKHAFILLALVLTLAMGARGGDPDILTDFVVPQGANEVNATFFTYTGMRTLIQEQAQPANFTVTKATMAEFPALNGQSVSYAVLQFPVGTVNPPHTHPRASELLLLTYGSLEVGFIDTTSKLYTQTLQAGDIFVFPKGLVHFQYNPSPKDFALAVSAFGSASAGTVSLPVSVFGTGIDDTILAKSFKSDVQTIQKLKAGLTPPPK